MLIEFSAAPGPAMMALGPMPHSSLENTANCYGLILIVRYLQCYSHANN